MHKTFDFKNYDSWIYIFKELFEESDYTNDQFKIELREFILKRYTHVVYYHASATDNLYTYLNNGILLSSVEKRIEYARKLLNKHEYSEITDEFFNNAKNKYLKDTSYIYLNEGKIYFAIDDDALKDRGSTHYACYGGEYLLSFVNILGNKYKYELKKKLIPIILKCKISIELLQEENTIDDIVADVINKYNEITLFPSSRLSIGSSTPVITSNIGPDCILGCEFPKYLKCE